VLIIGLADQHSWNLFFHFYRKDIHSCGAFFHAARIYTLYVQWENRKNAKKFRLYPVTRKKL